MVDGCHAHRDCTRKIRPAVVEDDTVFGFDRDHRSGVTENAGLRFTHTDLSGDNEAIEGLCEALARVHLEAPGVGEQACANVSAAEVRNDVEHPLVERKVDPKVTHIIG